ncbi:hypothetical protein VNO78_08183 [Psophocarpus tetragonolobus]|uniref:Secreted protein n=1 Tax=Psophocarpus tetragonolobus TaxID=3891 RepID=A0AAN9SUN5_PSOTE
MLAVRTISFVFVFVFVFVPGVCEKDRKKVKRCCPAFESSAVSVCAASPPFGIPSFSFFFEYDSTCASFVKAKTEKLQISTFSCWYHRVGILRCWQSQLSVTDSLYCITCFPPATAGIECYVSTVDFSPVKSTHC